MVKGQAEGAIVGAQVIENKPIVDPNANMTGAGAGTINSAGELRRVQFGLKLSF